MKPNAFKVVKMEYLSKLLFIISIVALLLFVMIVTIGDGTAIGIALVILVASLALFAMRLMNVLKDLEKFKDTKALATVIATRTNNGLLYISYSFSVEAGEFKKRVPFLCGPLKKMKLSKLKEVNIVYDSNNPKKSYIADFFY